MLYLEDYLEMIEHLPQELRDRFTDMREMDLSVQNNMDTLDKRVHVLFSQCRRGETQGTAADAEFVDIRKDYYRTLEDADEKVQLSNQMYDLVERYLRRLDTELYKFKCELEADHNGITEILEKRSLDLDNSGGHSMKSSAVTQKENRYFGSIGVSSGSSALLSTPSSHDRAVPTESRYRTPKQEKRDTNLLTPILSAGAIAPPSEKRPMLASSLSMPAMQQRADGPSSSSLLSGTPSNQSSVSSSASSLMGAGSAITLAASQAIVATQQMQQGRRTASLKASFEAIHGGSAVVGSGIASMSGSHDLLLGAAMQAVDRESSFNSQQRKQKKKMSAHGGMSSSSSSALMSSGSTSGGLLSGTTSSLSSHLSQQSSAAHSNVSVADSLLESPSVLIDDSGMVVEQTTDGEWTYDPNEPRYCICNQVSYGDMVACDNEDCPFEWFHYPCVGITSSPKGKWYCPQCIAAHQRRRGGSRKN